MTEQLKELIGSIKARLSAAGFTEIDSASKFIGAGGIRQSGRVSGAVQRKRLFRV